MKRPVFSSSELFESVGEVRAFNKFVDELADRFLFHFPPDRSPLQNQWSSDAATESWHDFDLTTMSGRFNDAKNVDFLLRLPPIIALGPSTKQSS